MQAMRDLLRSGLGRALRACEPLDRLQAAWPVAAGAALALHGTLTGIEDGILTIRVDDPAWLAQMLPLRTELAHELGRTARVPVRQIHFSGAEPSRASRSAAHAASPRPRATAATLVNRNLGGRR